MTFTRGNDVADQPDADAPVWQLTSRCNNGNCVEVALLPKESVVAVRDNAANSPILTFSADEWNAFISTFKGHS